MTPSGNLVTTFRSPSSGIDSFDPSGRQIASFSIATTGAPGDLSVFADGLLAVNDQSGAIQAFTNALLVMVVAAAHSNAKHTKTVIPAPPVDESKQP